VHGDLKRGSLLLLAAVVLAGCPQRAGTRDDNARTIVVRSPQEPDGLNPYLTGMSAAVDAYQPIFSGLLAVDDQLHFVPDLALEVPTPENGGVASEGKGMVVTYHLRHGVRWHDGRPFTSKDVAFTQKVIADPKVLVVERQGHDLIDRVETPDPYTAKVHFREVYAPYLQLFKAILPAHILEHEADINHCAFNRAPVGTGPFKFDNWRSGDRLAYKANPDYFRGAPAFDRLEFKVVPDDNAAFVQLKNGVIDVYQTVNLSQYRAVQKLEGVKVYTTPALLWEHLSFNTEKAFFKDVRVRQAIAMAIDKNVLSDKVYDGVYKPAWCDQNPRSWAYSPDLVNDWPYDPARAARLLDEAGWKPGADGVRVKDGKRFSVSFSTTAGKKNRETAQLLIRHFLKQVGIEVKIANYAGVSLFGAYPTGIIKSGKFDMAMWAWETGPDPDNLNSWHSDRIPPNGSNQTRYRNKDLDHVLEAATRTFRQNERQALYRKASHILAKDLPNIPLLYWTVLDAATTRLEGFRPNPSSAGNLWNVYEWRPKAITEPSS
jgi:peptide/nickel transport system substrate-binding protein